MKDSFISDGERIVTWEKQLEDEDKRASLVGEQPNYGEEFAEAIILLRKYYDLAHRKHDFLDAL